MTNTPADTPAPQTIGQAGGIDASRGERLPDPAKPGRTHTVARREAAETGPADDVDEHRAAIVGTADAAAYAEAESLDEAALELDPLADFLACDAPLTVCAAMHDHRDVGDRRNGGIARGNAHTHDNLGGSDEYLRKHLAEAHQVAASPGATSAELAEFHVVAHDIETEERAAFRSPQSFGAVLSALIHGDWLDTIEELANVALLEAQEAGDLEPVAALLWSVEKARKALQLSEDNLRARLSYVMRNDLHARGVTAVPGFGSFEAKAGAVRKDWDTDRAVAMVNHRGMATRGIVDDVTGEVVDGDRQADYLAGSADLLAAGTLSLRVGGLATFGLDADDFCTREHGRATVIARWNDGL